MVKKKITTTTTVVEEVVEGTGRTLIGFVLDASGSMSSCREAAISGFNEYVQRLQNDPNTFLALTLFDTDRLNKPRLVTRFSERPIASVEKLTEASYVPDGGTPLYDAVASVIRAIERSAKPGDNVTIGILTDGAENSSIEFRTSDQIRKLIEERQSAGWVIAYIGSVQDPWSVSGQMGIFHGNTMHFQQTPVGTASAMASFSSATHARTMAYAGGQAVAYAASAQSLFNGAQEAEEYVAQDEESEDKS